MEETIMILKGKNFGNIFFSAGASNFFLDGYRQQRLLNYIPGYTEEGAIKKTKTTTLLSCKGFMPLNDKLQPTESIPKCVHFNIFTGISANVVGLSGPGIKELLRRNIWQQLKELFVLSVMANGDSAAERLQEMQKIAEILMQHLPYFVVKPGIELNISCGNIGHNPLTLANETLDQGKALAPLGLPLFAKFSPITPIDTIRKAADSGIFDAVTLFNTYPISAMPEKLRKKLFPNGVSPLVERGLPPGSAAGPFMLPLVAEGIYKIRKANQDIMIVGGGGIRHPKDVILLKQAGANAVELGITVKSRPWRVRPIINEANKQFGGNA